MNKPAWGSSGESATLAFKKSTARKKPIYKSSLGVQK